jgi:hypothetical protein
MAELPGTRVARLASGRALRALDTAVIAWTVIWIAMGVWVGIEVHGLASLSDTVAQAGTALDRTGETLGTIDRIPLVGGQVGPVASAVSEAGKSATASGISSRGDVERLSVLLGIVVGLVPTVPLLTLYIPARVLRRREQSAIIEGVRKFGDDAAFTEFLARRAAERLPYQALRSVSENPWRDLEEGRHLRLAELELRRLDVRRERPTENGGG